jgi:drug/metabolite transporter (DMT)-like permease
VEAPQVSFGAMSKSSPAISSSPRATIPLLAYVCLALSMALVGSYVALSKLLVVVFPVLLLAWLRFLIASVAMAGWVRRAPGEATLSVRDRRLLFLEAFFGNFLFSILMLYGITLTSALAAGVIMASIPAVVGLMSWMILRERIGVRLGAAILLAFAGIALLSAIQARLAPASGGTSAASAAIWGNLLLFGAVCCEAIYVVIGKQLTANVSAKRISALINLWGCALITPFGLYYAFRFDFGVVPAELWLLVVFYALAASVVTVWLWMTGLKHVAASSAGVFTVMLPISAATVGVVVLGETFTHLHGAAFVLALSGLVLATWPARTATTMPLPH